jgi:hypothetical protein
MLDSSEKCDDEISEALVGWTTERVCLTRGVEGGLTFYLAKDNHKRRVILGYTELGEWLEACEDE